MESQDVIKEQSNVWIFGYGSLLWKPDFTYKRSVVGHIAGYKRRFWQGDVFYRGDSDKVRFAATSACDTFIYYYIVFLKKGSQGG